ITRGTDCIDRRALTVRIRHANSSSERIHGVNDEITAPDSLVANLLEGFGEPGRSAVCPQRDRPIAETSNRAGVTCHRSSLFLEEPLGSLFAPVTGQGSHPGNVPVRI